MTTYLYDDPTLNACQFVIVSPIMKTYGNKADLIIIKKVTDIVLTCLCTTCLHVFDLNIFV